MQDEPMRPLSRYIKEVLRIRKMMEDTIYYGEFLDQLEAEVETHDNVRWNTHRHPGTGQRACVLANLGNETRQATVRFADGSVPVRIHAPFQEVVTATQPAAFTIEPRRLAVVVEE